MSDHRSIMEEFGFIEPDGNSTNSSNSNNGVANVPPEGSNFVRVPLDPTISTTTTPRPLLDASSGRYPWEDDIGRYIRENRQLSRSLFSQVGNPDPSLRSESAQGFGFGQNIQNARPVPTAVTGGIPNRQTGAEKYHCIEHHWAIEEFGKYLTNPSPDPNFVIRSPKFDGDGISKFKWDLTLNPNNTAEDGQKWISIFLNLFTSSNDSCSESNNQIQFVELTAEVGLEIDGNLINCNRYQDVRISKYCGWPNFSKTPTQIQNEQIVVHCKVWLGCASIKHENLAPKVEPAGQNLGKIQTDFELILKAGKFSDAQIEVGSDVFKVHKSILAGRSEFFMGYFEANDNDDHLTSSKIVVQDFSKEMVEKMLEYMYTGKTEIIKDNVKELWQIGNKYSVVDLKNDCENVLVKSLKVDICIDILLFSDIVGASLVKSKAIEFIINNKSEISGSSAFKEMLESNHKLCRDILESDFIPVGVKRLKVSHPSN